MCCSCSVCDAADPRTPPRPSSTATAAPLANNPDWDEYRTVMVSDRRVLMSMTVDHVYGADLA
ncbi:hypothetical protein GCM10009827_053900 [Dactylosporangium maewongense]|uniref:Uncharacterized protein n=1 Tax=Dactylosporangium maewongense TaxID=634393 RepID=A0ABN2B0M9_9ACTN